MKVSIDLGNSNYKLQYGEKVFQYPTNVQKASEGDLGAWKVNGSWYLISESAKAKKTTNKITEDKKVLLARALYSIVQDKDQEIDIATLLPLSQYINKNNKEHFVNLLQGDYEVENPNGAVKRFTVRNVEVYCEGYSSLATDTNLLKQPIFLLDIGGCDLSAVYVHGTPKIDRMFTIEKGMNVFHEELGRQITSKTLKSCTEQDAQLHFNNYESSTDEMKAIIDDFANKYIDKNIMDLLADKGYDPVIHKLICVGGGSIDLQRYLEDRGATILKDALTSNVQGAMLQSIARGGK